MIWNNSKFVAKRSIPTYLEDYSGNLTSLRLKICLKKITLVVSIYFNCIHSLLQLCVVKNFCEKV